MNCWRGLVKLVLCHPTRNKGRGMIIQQITRECSQASCTLKKHRCTVSRRYNRHKSLHKAMQGRRPPLFSDPAIACIALSSSMLYFQSRSILLRSYNTQNSTPTKLQKVVAKRIHSKTCIRLHVLYRLSCVYPRNCKTGSPQFAQR